MAHTANYENIYATTNNGLSIEEIAAALGRRGTSDLGQLCADKRYENGQLVDAGKVNRWSPHKPVRLNSYERVTDQKFAELNYGLTMNKRLLSALRTSYDGFLWDYERPLAPYFRQLDFDGYKRGATPPIIYFAVPYLRTNTESSISFEYSNDGSDIAVLNINVPTTSQASAPSRPLSSWTVFFFVYIPGRNLWVYNTGDALADFSLQKTYSISGLFLPSDLGKTANVMACLAYPDSTVTVGLHEITGAAFMTNNYFVPLNFDDTYAATKSVNITQFYWLPGGFVNYTVFRPAASGHNYYALTNLGVSATGNNTGTNTLNFSARLVLNRNNVLYYSANTVSETLTNTRTDPPYSWDYSLNAYGEVNFGSSFHNSTTTTQLQTGDTLSIEVTVYTTGGTELQTITRGITI